MNAPDQSFIFGSFRLREKPQEIALGLDGWHEREWRRLPGMLTAPFRKSPARDSSQKVGASAKASPVER
jgi:hypothetical protein